MATASMSGRDSAAEMSLSGRAPCRPARSCARSNWTSTTTLTSAPERLVIVCACRSPMTPAPTTANFICHSIGSPSNAAGPSTVGHALSVQHRCEGPGRPGEQLRAAETSHRCGGAKMWLHREEPIEPVGLQGKKGLRQLAVPLAGGNDLPGGHHRILDLDVVQVRPQHRVAICEGRHPALDEVGGIPVSYTHLRAHETVLDLVCRLL